MPTTDPPDDNVSIISFGDELYLEDDYGLPSSDTRIQHWLSQQCRFAPEANSNNAHPSSLFDQEKVSSTLMPPGEILPSVLTKPSTRADSPLLGYELDDNLSRKHSPHSSHSSNTSSSHSVTPAATSSPPRRLTRLSRRPSLLKQPSLPLLGELDDEVQSQVTSPPIIPQTSRSRAQSNASLSSFHLPTSMQLSLQNSPATPSSLASPPVTPISPPPIVSPMGRRHSRLPNTPPVPSTLTSFRFGLDGDVPSRPPISRPQSHLVHHNNATQRHHNQISPSHSSSPKIISRSSSTLSLSLLTNNRNAVYIDEMIDIQSEDVVDDFVASATALLAAEGVEGFMAVEGGQHNRQYEEEEHDILYSKPPNTPEVYFNAIGSTSQVYLGSSEVKKSARRPTRPPPAPPLIMDGVVDVDMGEQGGLGGVGVIDEDAILSGDADEERGHFAENDSLWRDNTVRRPRRQPQHVEFEENNAIQHENDLDADVHVTDTDLDGEGGGNVKKLSMSRWSLTSSIDESITSPSGGLFGSRKRKSWAVVGGGDREKGKEKIVEKEKSVDKEKEKEKSTDKKRGRLVSLLSRISSNIASPPSSASYLAASTHNKGSLSPSLSPDAYAMAPGSVAPLSTLGFWFGDIIPPTPSLLSPVADVDVKVAKDKNKKSGKDKDKKSKRGQERTGKEETESELEKEREVTRVQVDDKDDNDRKRDSLPPLPVDADDNGSPVVNTDPKTATSKVNEKATSKASLQGVGSALDFMGVRSGSALDLMEGSRAVVGGRARSSSAGDLLGRNGGAYQDSDQSQHRHQYQHQHRQQIHQGQVHPQPQQSQNPQQGYSSESGYPSYHQQEESQQRQSQYRSQLQSELQLQQHLYRQWQTYSSDGCVLGGPWRPVAIDTVTGVGAGATSARRPGLVKSVSTPMLSAGFGYGRDVARRDADLPPTPASFTIVDDREDEECRNEVEGGDKEVQEVDEEEDDYGVEATHGRWRGGVGLAYDSDGERERDMTTRNSVTECKGTLQPQYLEEHSSTATHTPRRSAEISVFSSSSRSTRSNSTIITKTQGQIELLVQGVDKKYKSRRNHSVVESGYAHPAVGPTSTPTPIVKTGSGPSKGFRGFVERIMFPSTSTNTSTSSLSSSSSPTIASAPSTSSLFTTATTSTAASNASPSASHSPTASFVMGSSSDGSLFSNDRFLGQKKTQKKQPKRKLVINGVSEDDMKGYEAVKAWCESFGEVREMKRTPDGYLHVDFRKASVAETVCRLKTQVFIKGAGSVSLSWYTEESKGLLL